MSIIEVMFLLRIDVNVVDQDDPLRPTPLLIACERQNVRLVSMLLKRSLKPKPAKINVENTQGKRPIWYSDQTLKRTEIRYLKDSKMTPIRLMYSIGMI